MIDNQRKLPLFPLNVVLFPNASLPLQIFEERYKLLLKKCIDTDLQFGIVLIKSGDEVGGPAIPHKIGTLAKITEIKSKRDGTFNINVTGLDRFKIDEISHDNPYMQATVSALPEDKFQKLTNEKIESLQWLTSEQIKLLHGLQGGWANNILTPDNPVQLSWLICGILQISNEQKQCLLEESSPTKRLEMQMPILLDNIDLLKKKLIQKYSFGLN